MASKIPHLLKLLTIGTLFLGACSPATLPGESATSSSSSSVEGMESSKPTASTAMESSASANAREMDPAVSLRAKCQAQCRDTYGGSGNAGFDACIRACGEGAAKTTAACPSPGPACPSPQSPVCHDGTWYCREHVPGAMTDSDAELNYPSEEQLREAACPELAMACEVPTTPACKNGKWICVGPATPVK